MRERPYAPEYFCAVWVRHDDDATTEENVTETSTGLRRGQQMPNFELPDEEGRSYNLLEHLEEGLIILVFYRGDW